MEKITYFFILTFISNVYCDDSTIKTVEITQGLVQGHLANDGSYYSFYGIPYATTPKGADKFKGPLPAPNWTEPFNATFRKIQCFQKTLFPPEISDINMTEDCLVANIFVPITNKTDLPVLVSIHGGAYQTGEGYSMKPGKLVTQGQIIFLSFNYRLGVHGFLCLGTEAAPGNAGLKDILALLHWVKTNIAAFGGNPNDVTIEGCSAGAAAVELLTLLPKADGLFKKAIMGSGAGISNWSIQQNPIETAVKFAAQLNLHSKRKEELDSFYKTQTIKTLYSVEGLYHNNKDEAFGFVPCVENVSDESVLEDAPINMLMKDNKKIPVLMFFSNKEGMLRLPNFYEWILDMNQNFHEYLPSDLIFKNIEDRNETTKKIRKYYFGEKDILNKDSINAFVDYASDRLITYPQFRSASIRKNAGSEIFLYEYKHIGLLESLITLPHFDNGAGHCSVSVAFLDDIFHLGEDSIKYSEVRTFLRKMIIDFIKYGNPTRVNIPESVADVILDVSPYNQAFNATIKSRLDFWNEIYDKYYLQPKSP